MRVLVPLLAIALLACTNAGEAPVDDHVDGESDAAIEVAPEVVPEVASEVPADVATEADAGAACAVFGAPGECTTVAACAAKGSHSSYAGHCPGAATIECCIKTPNVADNPKVPAGYKLMMQSEVTSEMTTWAVAILYDPVTYPMFSTTTKTFGTKTVLARVEWHPPDFLNGAVHRGVTLYEPI